MVREADLAGPRDRAAARQRHVGHGVMRRAERTRAHQAHARRQQAGDGVNRRHLQRFLEIERRQDPGRALGHHRLAGAGRTREQDVVPAGGGNLQRPARELLTAHVGEVAVNQLGALAARVRRQGDGVRVVERRPRPPSATERDRTPARRRPPPRRRSSRAAAGRGTAASAPWPRSAAPRAPPGCRRRATAPQDQDVVDVAPRDDAGRRQHAERDRQIERRPRLSHVRGREIDGDAMPGELVARIPNGAADAIAALADAGIRKPHHREARQAERDVNLDRDGRRVDTEDRRGPQACEHAARPLQTRAQPPRSRVFGRKFRLGPPECSANAQKPRQPPVSKYVVAGAGSRQLEAGS